MSPFLLLIITVLTNTYAKIIHRKKSKARVIYSSFPFSPSSFIHTAKVECVGKMCVCLFSASLLWLRASYPPFCVSTSIWQRAASSGFIWSESDQHSAQWATSAPCLGGESLPKTYGILVAEMDLNPQLLPPTLGD